MTPAPSIRRIARHARALVVRTADWPVLGAAYQGIYALQARRVSRALGGVDGIRVALLRGSTGNRVHPGLSDIDVVVVLDGSLTVDGELRACEALYQTIRRVNLGAPLVRDVHVFTESEIRALAALGAGLYGGFLFDSFPVAGSYDWPAPSADPRRLQEALLREVAFWVGTCQRHLARNTRVEHGLAARAHAKAICAAEQLERGSLESLWRGYAASSRVPAHTGQLVALARRLDSALPDAPKLEAGPAEEQPHLAAAVPELRAWTRPLQRHPAIVGAVLSVEGARERDLRLFIVVDPDHPRAADGWDAVGRCERAQGFPNHRFSRFPWPIVVTPAQLARSIYQRWTATEPLARLRHGVSLFGQVEAPRARDDEMTRALALDVLGTSARLREILATRVSIRRAAHIVDAVDGLLPSFEARVLTGEWRTRSAGRMPAALDAVRQRAEERAFRLEALTAVRRSAEGPLAQLVSAEASP